MSTSNWLSSSPASASLGLAAWLLLLVSGCTGSSSTTELAYLPAAPSVRDCDIIFIQPSTICPWTLSIVKNGAGSLRYGNLGDDAEFPPGTFAFSEVYHALSGLQPVDPLSKGWCLVEFWTRREPNDDPAIKSPRRRQRFQMYVKSSHPAIRKLFLRAESLCEEHWTGSKDDLKGFRKRTPINSI